MASLTTLTPLPYPDPQDQPFVHLDIQALAEATAENLPVRAPEAPPHRPGRVWIDSNDGDRMWRSVNGAWEVLAGAGAAVGLSYAANYGDQPGTPLRFRRIGRTVTVAGSFTNVAALGNAAADTSYPLGTLPATHRPVGMVKLPLMVYQGSGNPHIGELRIEPSGGVAWRVYGYAQTANAPAGSYDGSTTGAFEV